MGGDPLAGLQAAVGPGLWHGADPSAVPAAPCLADPAAWGGEGHGPGKGQGVKDSTGFRMGTFCMELVLSQGEWGTTRKH